MNAILQPVDPPEASFPGISQGVVISGDCPMVLSGHVPADAKGNLVTGNFKAQLTAAFETLGRTLEALAVLP